MYRLAITLLAVANATPALAHDFWLSPSAWRCDPGAGVSLTLQVGDAYRGEVLPRDPGRLERFFSVSSDGTRADVRGVNGVTPAGFLRPRSAGLLRVGYVSKPEFVMLGPARFESYLLEEGLEAISRRRRALGERRKPGLEHFSRSVKTLVRVGEANTRGFDQPIGLPLELTPGHDPFAAEPGATIELRLLYRDEPLRGALVTAVRRGAKDAVQEMRSDAEGRVRMRVTAADDWLVSAVHMVRADAEAGSDWESLWTSITFRTAEKSSEPEKVGDSRALSGRPVGTP